MEGNGKGAAALLFFGAAACRAEARSAILIEARTGRVLEAHNAHEPLPMASTTKIMMALLALEQGKLDDVVTAGPNAFGVPGTSLYLSIGEQLTLEQMLYDFMRCLKGQLISLFLGLYKGQKLQRSRESHPRPCFSIGFMVCWSKGPSAFSRRAAGQHQRRKGIMRLQKYMAECGVASRRKAEEMIAAGQVTVNGTVVTQMGTQVEEGDEVRVDGRVIRPEAEKRYIIYHKPAGEVTTVSDPEGRTCVLDHFRDFPVRLYPVGRLDYDSEGLLLLTNDGALTERMLHPSHQVDKTYLARVTGSVSLDSVRQLRQGVLLDDHKTSPAKVRVIKLETFATQVLVTIHEGRNRQVRRMFEAVGHQVLQLRRVKFGPLELGDLPRGQWRELTGEELRKLQAYL